MARRIEGEWLRGSGADFPARLGAAGHRPGARPQQEQRDAGRLRREDEPALRRQVQLLGLAEGLDEDGADGGAACCLDAGPQHRDGMGKAHQHESCRVEPERAKPVDMELAALPRRMILSYPDDGPFRRGAGEGKQGGKSVRRGLVASGGGMEFVQGAAGEPAAEMGIDLAAIDRDEPRRRRTRNLARRLDRRDALPQGGKGRRFQTHPRHPFSILVRCS